MTRWMIPFVLALLGSTLAAAEEAPSAPGVEILAALGAAAIDCDEGRSSRYDEHIVTRCGMTDQTAKSLKKTWRKAARRGPLSKRLQWDGASWKTTGATEKTMYTAFLGIPVAVSVDFADGVIAIYSPRSFPGCHAEHSFEWVAGAGSVPQPIQREFAEYPEEARIRPTAGAVLGSFVVDETGRVTDVCIVAIVPPGMGFGRAAADAQRRARYRPATHDGQPVAAAAMFFTTFELGTEAAPVSILVREFFKQAGAGR